MKSYIHVEGFSQKKGKYVAQNENGLWRWRTQHADKTFSFSEWKENKTFDVFVHTGKWVEIKI